MKILKGKKPCGCKGSVLSRRRGCDTICFAYANVASLCFPGGRAAGFWQSARLLVLMTRISIRRDIAFMDLIVITISVQVAERKTPSPLTFYSTCEAAPLPNSMGAIRKRKTDPLWNFGDGRETEVSPTSETCSRPAARRKNGKGICPSLDPLTYQNLSALPFWVCLVPTKFPNFPSYPSHLLSHRNIKYSK